MLLNCIALLFGQALVSENDPKATGSENSLDPISQFSYW
jgi:hypothetical protein